MGGVQPGYELEVDNGVRDPAEGGEGAQPPAEGKPQGGKGGGGKGGDMERLFNTLKSRGIIDRGMTFDQFAALQEEEEENGGE